MDIKRKIIQKFNEHLGSDLKNLEGIYDFEECLKVEKDEIERSVSVYLQNSVMYNAKRCCLSIASVALTAVDGIDHYSVQGKSCG